MKEPLPSKLYSIGYLAKLFDTSTSLLRFYDKYEVFSPAYRDETTGYRYYSEDQFFALDIILMLRDMDFSVAEIRSIVQNVNSRADLVRALKERKESVNRRIERQIRIGSRLNEIEREFSDRVPQTDVFKIRDMPERRLLCLPSKSLSVRDPHRSAGIRIIMNEYRKHIKSEYPKMISMGTVCLRSKIRHIAEITYSYHYVELLDAEIISPSQFIDFIAPNGRYLTYEFRSTAFSVPKAYKNFFNHIDINGYLTDDYIFESVHGVGLPPVSKDDEVIELQIRLLQ